MLVLLALAGLALLHVDTQKRCPVTGTPLTAAQLADDSLRVGGKTMCCKDCVRKYAARMRATATARAGRDAYEDGAHAGHEAYPDEASQTRSLGSYII